MKRNRSTRKQKKRGINAVEMFVVSTVVLVLLSFMLYQSTVLKKKNDQYVQKIENLDKELENERERTQEISELESEVNTLEYAGEVARERLSMVGEDEILFRADQ